MSSQMEFNSLKDVYCAKAFVSLVAVYLKKRNTQVYLQIANLKLLPTPPVTSSTSV